MRRRQFITLLAGTAAAWPLTARAQQAAMPVIGYLSAGSLAPAAPFLTAFHESVRKAGYVEGQNVAIEYRWAQGKIDRLPELAADLVHRQVTAIVATGSTASASAAKAATSTIPVIFWMAADPVKTGLVASLNRPGGNLTGVTSLNAELVPKRLELLHDAVPTASTIAVLLNPTGLSAGRPSKDLQAAADALGLQLHIVHASTERDFDTVLTDLGRVPGSALLIPPDAFFLDRLEQLGAMSLRRALPAIYSYREFAAAGGLLSYGGSLVELGGLVGEYTGRILNGTKPVDLPVQQSTKVELIVNLKTAKALGITVPQSLLGRADELIE